MIVAVLLLALGALIPTIAPQDKLEGLVKGLEGPNPAARAMAAMSLAKFGPALRPRCRR